MISTYSDLINRGWQKVVGKWRLYHPPTDTEVQIIEPGKITIHKVSGTPIMPKTFTDYDVMMRFVRNYQP